LKQCEQIFEETKDPGGLSHLAFYKKLALEAGTGSTTSPIAILTGDLSHSNVSLSVGNQSSDDESSTSSENVPKDSKTIVVVGSATSGRKSTKPKPEKIIMPTSIPVTSSENGSKQVTQMDVPPLPADDEDDVSHPEFLHSSADPGLSLEEFIQYMNAKGRKGLFEEYNQIKSKPVEGTFECSRQRENQLKNRYTDVLCFDHSRVRLPHQDMIAEEEDETDYINAN
jgi:tyrosine-protein phosphatase non-receptor type 9